MPYSRVMIAAAKSGSGKTTITCSLLYALKEMGMKVRSYKCGPDYIDPMFHKSVIGIESKNLDLFFTDEDTTRELFLMDNDADISVIEGVMGLYDGLGGISEKASSYDLASCLEAPVILVVDAHGMGRSVLAEIAGFKLMDKKGLIKGVILNRTSKSFFENIKPLIEENCGVAALGYVPKFNRMVLDSRHLGLVLPNEVEKLEEKLSDTAMATLAGVNADRIIDIARNAADISRSRDDIKRAGKEKTPAAVTQGDTEGVRIAVAYDGAFCFYYEDNLRLFRENGAELVFFSPLNDEHLPKDIDGIVLGGGYPEVYADKLSENRTMLSEVKEAVEGGMPSLAECGGFMYLHSAMICEDGRTFKMAGVIDGKCYYTANLVRFGYISVNGPEECGYLPVRGHEFHYFDSNANGTGMTANKPVGEKTWKCGYLSDNSIWGFPHLYYPSNPELPKWFTGKCHEYKNRRNLQ